MKKKIKILTFLFMIMTLTGCSFINTNMRNITEPKINKTPINGSWTVTKVIFVKNDREYFDYKDKIGSDVYFSNKGFIIDGYYFENPSIRSKVVNTEKFLGRKYQIEPSALGIDKEKLTIVNLYNSKDLVYQILKVEENESYVYLDGVFLQLSRVSEDISEEEFESIKSRGESKLINLKEQLDANSKDNGILLGIKYKNENNIKYRSFYLKFNNDDLESVEESKGLKIPTDEGLLSIDEDNKQVTLKNENGEEKKENLDSDSEINEIMYASDDYLSLRKETIEGRNSLVFKYTDDIEKDRGIPFSKLIDDGDKVFKKQALKYGEEGYINDVNFGIKRKDGKFMVFGLMSYRDSAKEDVWFDLGVDINRILDHTAELNMPFENIKTYLPDLRDAVISSNNRFIVTMENSTLNIYNIVNAELGSKKIYSIEIPQGSEIVQIERYVGNNSVEVRKKLNTN